MIKEHMRLLIAGSRTFEHYPTLEDTVDYLTRYSQTESWHDRLEIVSGGARGADRLAERYALERNLPIRVFPADWEQHGKAAGPIRNREMALYCTHAILFWDGRSPGTRNMRELCLANNIKVAVHRIDRGGIDFPTNQLSA